MEVRTSSNVWDFTSKVVSVKFNICTYFKAHNELLQKNIDLRCGDHVPYFACIEMLVFLFHGYRKDKPKWPKDACRIYGSLTLNKVSGNLHVSAGKPLALPVGHVHLTPFMTGRAMNFSHRIHKFSFGDPSPGIIHPMEGDEKITDKSKHLLRKMSFLCKLWR